MARLDEMTVRMREQDTEVASLRTELAQAEAKPKEFVMSAMEAAATTTLVTVGDRKPDGPPKLFDRLALAVVRATVSLVAMKPKIAMATVNAKVTGLIRPEERANFIGLLGIPDREILNIDPNFEGTIGVWGAGDVNSADGQLPGFERPKIRQSITEDFRDNFRAGVFGESRGTGVVGLGSTGVHGQGGIGVHGVSNGVGVGVKGESQEVGVMGISRMAESDVRARFGVQGDSDSDHGVFGTTTADGKAGVFGGNTVPLPPTGTTLFGNAGVHGDSVHGDGVLGFAHAADKSGVAGFNDSNVGVFGHGATGVGGVAIAEGKAGVSGQNDFPVLSGTAGFGTAGVQGSSSTGDGVIGIAHVSGKSGVAGFNDKGTGVFGTSVEGFGMHGNSDHSIGVHGTSRLNDGIAGTTAQSGKSGVLGENKGNPDPLVSGLGISTDLFGVTGRADSPSGFGVFGDSREGTGILGQAGDGGLYGGLFKGGKAPLRLVPSTTKGAPNSGFHEKGEFFVDTEGGLFYCTTNGTPGTWIKLA